jgi:Rod binding domain-containing protein
MRLDQPQQFMPLVKCLHASDAKALKLTGAAADRQNDPNQARVQSACKSFEGFMLGEMMKQMRPVEESEGGILPTSRGEKMFSAQRCEALGEQLAAREPLGLARLLRSAIGSTGGSSNANSTMLDQPDHKAASGGTLDAYRSGANFPVRRLTQKSFPLPRR